LPEKTKDSEDGDNPEVTENEVMNKETESNTGGHEYYPELQPDIALDISS